MHLDTDTHATIILTPAVSSYELEMGGETTLQYLPCYECLVLLSSMEGTELEAEG